MGKNILILGDSWGVTENSQPRRQDWPEYYFMRRGHTVFNKCWGGAWNLVQLGFGDAFLRECPYPIDLVIWYHTEVFRDFARPPWEDRYKSEFGEPRDLVHLLDWQAERTYQLAHEAKLASPATQWAIIGGGGPVVQSQRSRLEWADLLIDDWKSEIVGEQLPECHFMQFYDYIWQWRETLGMDAVQAELDKRQYILEAMARDRSLFWDRIHPAHRPVLAMNLRLQEWFDL